VTLIIYCNCSAFWQRRLAMFVLVGVFDGLSHFRLFIVRQLVRVIDLYLVARYLRFVLVGIALLFHDLGPWNRVLGVVWVSDRYVTVVADRDLRSVWQRRLTVVVLVGVFDCLSHF